jgi:two-component system sensor histidine kinase KdpD
MGPEAVAAFPGSRARGAQSAGAYLQALLLVAGVTALLWALRDALTLANLSLLYLLAIVVAAIWLGTGPSLVAAATSFVAFNFFLIRPFYTLAIEDPREVLDLFVFLVVAIIAGQLASYARKQADAARLYAAEQAILYSLSSSFNQITDREDITAELQRIIPESLAARRVTLLPEAHPPDVRQDPAATYVLLKAGGNIYGTLVVTFDADPSPTQSRLVAACAEQAAMPGERASLRRRTGSRRPC